MIRFLVLNAGPIDIDSRYKNMGDRSAEQEFIIANWQNALNDKLLELGKDYPGYKIYCFGRAYVYRFFYI